MKKIRPDKALFTFFVLFSLTSLSSNAITSSDATDQQYLYNHGHSTDVINLVNLQKARAEGKDLPNVNQKNKYTRLIRKIFKEPDDSYALEKFGNNKINVQN